MCAFDRGRVNRVWLVHCLNMGRHCVGLVGWLVGRGMAPSVRTPWHAARAWESMAKCASSRVACDPTWN